MRVQIDTKDAASSIRIPERGTRRTQLPHYDFGRWQNSDQNDPANCAPFRRVCHHGSFPTVDADLRRRKAARPANNEVAAKARELMILARLAIERTPSAIVCHS